jgi:hypothetical protein
MYPFASDAVEKAWELDRYGIDYYLSLDEDGVKPNSPTALFVEVAKKAAGGKGTNGGLSRCPRWP